MLWDELALPWQRCLDEAWTAYCAGSIPIGAVVVDAAGAIVGAGRNRIFEPAAPPPFLAGHRLAHAEVNALVGVDRAGVVNLRDCMLYTTTEPCPLCAGAIRMARLAAVHYAARDAAAGSIALLDASPFMRKRGIQVYGPERADLEALIVALHVEFSLRFDRAGADKLIALWEHNTPTGVALGQALSRSGELDHLRQSAVATPTVVRRLATLLK